MEIFNFIDIISTFFVTLFNFDRIMLTDRPEWQFVGSLRQIARLHVLTIGPARL